MEWNEDIKVEIILYSFKARNISSAYYQLCLELVTTSKVSKYVFLLLYPKASFTDISTLAITS